MDDRRFSLMVHGGAGTLDDARQRAMVMSGVRRSARCWRMAAGCSSAGIVRSRWSRPNVMLLEDDPLFNAGRGSVLNEAGAVEMDAAIMDGRDLLLVQWPVFITCQTWWRSHRACCATTGPRCWSARARCVSPPSADHAGQ